MCYPIIANFHWAFPVLQTLLAHLILMTRRQVLLLLFPFFHKNKQKQGRWNDSPKVTQAVWLWSLLTGPLHYLPKQWHWWDLGRLQGEASSEWALKCACKIWIDGGTLRVFWEYVCKWSSRERKTNGVIMKEKQWRRLKGWLQILKGVSWYMWKI